MIKIIALLAVFLGACLDDAVDSTDAGNSVSDATVSDAMIPDAMIPDATVSDVTVPDAMIPDAMIPDATMINSGVGGPCQRNSDCDFEKARCFPESNGPPGGYCTKPCEPRFNNECPGNSECVDVSELDANLTNICVAVCSVSVGCRSGYECGDGLGINLDICWFPVEI